MVRWSKKGDRYEAGKKPDPALAKLKDLPRNGTLMVGDKDTLYVPHYWGAGQFLSHQSQQTRTGHVQFRLRRPHCLIRAGFCKPGRLTRLEAE